MFCATSQMILVYPVGIPLLFFAVLYRYRTRLQEPEVPELTIGRSAC